MEGTRTGNVEGQWHEHFSGNPDSSPAFGEADRSKDSSEQPEHGEGAVSPAGEPVHNGGPSGPSDQSGVSKGGNAGHHQTRPQSSSGGNVPSKRKPSTASGHLMSYATPSKSASDSALFESADNQAKVEHKRRVEEAAVSFFLRAAASNWKVTEVMPPFNPGFDIKAVSTDGHDEFIEVKGQAHAWTEAGIALTPRELLTASEKGQRYWLCVVEYALDESRRRLWLVQDPFGKTDQFRFDRGWQAVAAKSEGAPMRPAVGLLIDTPDKGAGRIVRVMGAGNFQKVTFIREKNKPATVVFNPSTMKLSHN